MPITPALTASSACLLPLTLTFLLTVTSGSDRVWGGEGRKEGGEGTTSVELSAGGLPRQEVVGLDLCDTARRHCTVRAGCQRALSSLFDACRPLLSGQESRCSPACRHALVALLSTEDGAGLAFLHCDCGEGRDCEDRRRRVQACHGHVMHAMRLLHDPHSVLGCGLARGVCEADTSCLAALRYYVRHCGKLFAGTRCTARCRNSVLILYRQPQARKLRSCRCEGDEGYDCAGLTHNTERLCLQPHRHHHHHNHSHHHHQHQGRGEGGYRQPGRQPAGPITQSYTSGHSSLAPAGVVTVTVMYVTASLCVCLTLQ
ncbi:hypothetical protein ACOMHN_012235 [Nucella lapillus]